LAPTDGDAQTSLLRRGLMPIDPELELGEKADQEVCGLVLG
jgi:hypothetical protein